MSCSLESLFVREFERKDETILKINQCEVGDVGCVVWDAAIVLTSYLETADFRRLVQKSGLKNTRVVELGSGTGIIGLQAACLGADVTITDLPEFVPLLKLNIDENKDIIKGSASAQTLIWGKPIDKEVLLKPDLILLADCVYYDEAVSSLVSTITELAGPDTVVLCCYEERQLGNKEQLQRQFFQGIEEKFEVEEIGIERQDPVYSSEDIHIFKFIKKK